MRGRLIFPFYAQIERIDTNATRGDGAYDDDFKTFVPGAARVNLVPLRLPCQIEVNTLELQRMARDGNVPDRMMQLIFHFADLEREALVHETTGDALIRLNDKLTGIYDLRTGAIVQAIPNGGMFATKVEPNAFGIGRKRNLLFVVFAERAKGLLS